MVPTRQLAQLIDLVAAVEGKLVLVGDHRQLPELEAGGAFRGLVNRGLAIELTENLRQRHAWERGALDHLRDGRAEQALAALPSARPVHRRRVRQRSRERLVADWSATGDPSGSVMIAQRRDDVADLNARAREHMRAAGMLGTRSCDCPAASSRSAITSLVKRNDLRLRHRQRRARTRRGRRRRRAAAHARLPRPPGHARRRLPRRAAPSTATRRSCTATR